MAYSDEIESDLGTDKVTEYSFEDEKKETISFAVLPLYRDEEQEEEISGGNRNKKVFLNAQHTLLPANTNSYKQVIGWKLEMSWDKYIIWVLRKDGRRWVQLINPGRAYVNEVLSIFVTIECLHYRYRNPNDHMEEMWSHVMKKFSSYDFRPLKSDLQKHNQLIQHFSRNNFVLKEAKVVVELARCYGRKVTLDKAPQNLINANNSDEEEETDPICSFCDNGGDVLCCEGRCLRSFHATKADGSHSDCKSLGLSAVDVKAIPSFYCSNCTEKRHQCFACGKLGCSDNFSDPEVFRCCLLTCGHFYHPKCIAKLLHPTNEADAAAKELSIGTGEEFVCPVHQCLVCKKHERKEIEDLQLAVCRRCPKAYHRKCLPKEIFFENSRKAGIARAWDGLIPDKVLIYCLDHEIVLKLKTPLRNHIIFPKQNDLLVSRKHDEENFRKGENCSKHYTTEERSIKKPAEFLSAEGDTDNNKRKNSTSWKSDLFPDDVKQERKDKASPLERLGSFNLLEERPSSTFSSQIRAGKEHPKKYSRNFTPTDTRNSLKDQQHNIISGPDVASSENHSPGNDDIFGEISNSSISMERNAGSFPTPANRHQVATNSFPGSVDLSGTGVEPNASILSQSGPQYDRSMSGLEMRASSMDTSERDSHRYRRQGSARGTGSGGWIVE